MNLPIGFNVRSYISVKILTSRDESVVVATDVLLDKLLSENNLKTNN